jgi:hypothetical protein
LARRCGRVVQMQDGSIAGAERVSA